MQIPCEVLVVRYRRFPQNTSAEQMHSVLAMSARINTDSHIVLDLSTTLITRVADEFIKELLTGTNLLEDENESVERLRASYFGHADRGLIAAYRDLLKRYRAVTSGSDLVG